jgi:hypothetical protein
MSSYLQNSQVSHLTAENEYLGPLPNGRRGCRQLKRQKCRSTNHAQKICTPQSRKEVNGSMSGGYLGKIASVKEQCDMRAQTWDSRTRRYIPN